MLDNDKESILFRPQSPFYTEVGVRCAEKHIGVHLFLCSDGSLDVATIGMLTPTHTTKLPHSPRVCVREVVFTL